MTHAIFNFLFLPPTITLAASKPSCASWVVLPYCASSFGGGFVSTIWF
jgi:hypothetical protein